MFYVGGSAVIFMDSQNDVGEQEEHIVSMTLPPKWIIKGHRNAVHLIVNSLDMQ